MRQIDRTRDSNGVKCGNWCTQNPRLHDLTLEWRVNYCTKIFMFWDILNSQDAATVMALDAYYQTSYIFTYQWNRNWRKVGDSNYWVLLTWKIQTKNICKIQLRHDMISDTFELSVLCFMNASHANILKNHHHHHHHKKSLINIFFILRYKRYDPNSVTSVQNVQMSEYLVWDSIGVFLGSKIV